MFALSIWSEFAATMQNRVKLCVYSFLLYEAHRWTGELLSS